MMTSGDEEACCSFEIGYILYKTLHDLECFFICMYLERKEDRWFGLWGFFLSCNIYLYNYTLVTSRVCDRVLARFNHISNLLIK